MEQGRFLTYNVASSVSTGARQTIELGLALVCAELRSSAPHGWEPASVQLRHEAPSDPSLHRRAFGPALSFNQDRNAVLVDNALLPQPTLRTDAPRGTVAPVRHGGGGDHECRQGRCGRRRRHRRSGGRIGDEGGRQVHGAERELTALAFPQGVLLFKNSRVGNVMRHGEAGPGAKGADEQGSPP